jgi:hypothetical protein
MRVRSFFSVKKKENRGKMNSQRHEQQSYSALRNCAEALLWDVDSDGVSTAANEIAP